MLKKVSKKVLEVVHDEMVDAGLDVSRLKLDAELVTDLGIDSLGIVSIFVELDEHFEVGISDDDPETLTTPRAIAEYLNATVTSIEASNG